MISVRYIISIASIPTINCWKMMWPFYFISFYPLHIKNGTRSVSAINPGKYGQLSGQPAVLKLSGITVNHTYLCGSKWDSKEGRAGIMMLAL